MLEGLDLSQAEAHPCQEDKCVDEGAPCWLPYLEGDPENEPEPHAYYCGKHAFENGFCKGCGMFFAGTESFDFGQGWCSDCKSQLDIEDAWDEYFDPDEFDLIEIEGEG